MLGVTTKNVPKSFNICIFVTATVTLFLVQVPTIILGGSSKKDYFLFPAMIAGSSEFHASVSEVSVILA